MKPDIGSIIPMGFAQDGSFFYGIRTRSQNVYVATLDPASGQVSSPPVPAIDHFVGRNWSPGNLQYP